MKVNKVLLARDKFTSAMYLRQAGFTYSTCGTFTKKQRHNTKFKETGDSR